MQKQALITGATSGIGRATALRLAKEGYAVIATGRRADRLATLRAEIEAAGGRCTTLAFDVRSEEEVRRNLSPLENIDLLVNNAGLAAGLEHIDLGDTRRLGRHDRHNVKGLLYVTRVIAPKMVAAGRGHIFNIGSIAGTEAYENGAVYCASKHAVHAIFAVDARRPTCPGRQVDGRSRPDVVGRRTFTYVRRSVRSTNEVRVDRRYVRYDVPTVRTAPDRRTS